MDHKHYSSRILKGFKRYDRQYLYNDGEISKNYISYWMNDSFPDYRIHYVYKEKGNSYYELFYKGKSLYNVSSTSDINILGTIIIKHRKMILNNKYGFSMVKKYTKKEILNYV